MIKYLGSSLVLSPLKKYIFSNYAENNVDRSGPRFLVVNLSHRRFLEGTIHTKTNKLLRLGS